MLGSKYYIKLNLNSNLRVSTARQWHSQSSRVQPDLPTALIEYLTYLTDLLGYLDLLQSQWQGTANIWESLGSA